MKNARRHDAGHQCRLERQISGRAGSRCARQAASRATNTGCCRSSRTCSSADPEMAALIAQGPRALREQARRTARGQRGAALPPRQFQRHVRPGDSGRADGSDRCARSHSRRASAGARRILPNADDHARACDESNGDHLSVCDGERADGRSDQDPSWKTSATTCSIPIPTFSRAATWCASAACNTRAIRREHRRPHQQHDARRTSRSRRTRQYKVAGWAPVAEGASGEAVWDVVAQFLRAKKVVSAVKPNRPRLHGIGANPGLA